MIKAGISTASFYPMLTETAMEGLAKNGVRATEVFFNAPSELNADFTRRLAGIARDGGVEVMAVHPFTSGIEPLLFFSDYRRRTLDGFEFYKRYFDAANQLGAQILVIHGARREHPFGLTQYFDVFGELIELGKQQGITVAQENVPRCIGHDPAFFRAMREYLPDSKYVLDFKQALREGSDPLEMARAMGTGLCHLHISDHNEQSDCLPIGQGKLDLAALLQTLQEENGFDGAALLEVYRCSYDQLEELYVSCRAIEHAVDSVESIRRNSQ